MHYKVGKKRIFIAILFTLAAFQVNAETGTCTDGDITLTVEQGISLGSVVVPDSGTSPVEIDPSGARVIPGELTFGNTAGSQNQGAQFQTASLKINGPMGCKFSVTVGATPARVSNVKLLGVGGTTLNTAYSGAIGQLSSMGTATVHLGATVEVNSSDSADISESFQVSVALINEAVWD